MAVHRITFTSSAAASGSTAFTNPNNAMKTDTTTTSFASGSISNNTAGRSVGSNFIFPTIALPAGVNGNITALRLYTSKYSDNPGNTPFNVTIRQPSVTNLISNNTSGSGGTYNAIQQDLSLSLLNTAPTIDIWYTRGGGNGIAVRVPYVFIEIEYTPIVLVTSVTVTPSVLELEPGESSSLSASVLPTTATNRNITWSSTNTSIVSIDNATNTSVGINAITPGTATVRATAVDGSGVYGECVVTVKEIAPAPVVNGIYNGLMNVIGIYNGRTPVIAAYCGTHKIFPYDYAVTTGITQTGTIGDNTIPLSGNWTISPQTGTPYISEYGFSYRRKIDVQDSWWEDNNGIVRYFSADNTPLANFDSTVSAGSKYTINGIEYAYETVKKVSFGESYIGSDLSTIESLFENSALVYLDMHNLFTSPPSSVYLRWALNLSESLQRLNMSSNATLVLSAFGMDGFAEGCFSLEAIDIGSISFADPTVIEWGFAGVPTTGIIYASTLQHGENFKQKFINFLSEWTIVVGQMPAETVSLPGGPWTSIPISDPIASVWSNTYAGTLTNLRAGTEYEIKSYVIINGQRYESEVLSLQTTGEYIEDSYYTLVGDPQKYQFNSSNTPIANLATTGNASTSVTINGVSVVKNTIETIYLGASYSSNSSIPNQMCHRFTALNSFIFDPSLSIKTIGDFAFNYCSALRQLELREGITEFATGCLSNSGLETIIIPKSCTTINSLCFQECANLTAVVIQGTDCTIAANCVSYNDNLEIVELHEGIKTIGQWFLQYSPKITEIKLPASLERIIGDFNTSLFPYCPQLENIIVDERNQNYSSLNGVLYNKQLTTIIRCPENWKNSPSYILSDTVDSISAGCFYACSNLTSVVLNNTITYIPKGVFVYGGMSTIDLGNAVIYMTDYSTIRYMPNLTTLTMPSTLIHGNDAAISDLPQLSKIDFRYMDASLLSAQLFGNNIPNTSNCIRYHATQDLANKALLKWPTKFSNWTVVIGPMP